MTEAVEVSESVYARLEEAADALDMTTAALADDVLRRWLEKNYDPVADEESDEGSEDDRDED